MHLVAVGFTLWIGSWKLQLEALVLCKPPSSTKRNPGQNFLEDFWKHPFRILKAKRLFANEPFRTHANRLNHLENLKNENGFMMHRFIWNARSHSKFVYKSWFNLKEPFKLVNHISRSEAARSSGPEGTRECHFYGDSSRSRKDDSSS